jgi:hypothetical protein
VGSGRDGLERGRRDGQDLGEDELDEIPVRPPVDELLAVIACAKTKMEAQEKK